MSLGTEKAVLFKSSHIPPPLQLLSIELQAKCVLAVEKKIKAKCESSLQEDNTQLPQFSINITLGITKHHQLYQNIIKINLHMIDLCQLTAAVIIKS